MADSVRGGRSGPGEPGRPTDERSAAVSTSAVDFFRSAAGSAAGAAAPPPTGPNLSGVMIRPVELAGIKAGAVDLAFRRWDRPSVVVGTRMRTAVGLIEVT